jgi:Rod binding domain-containing protein
MVNLPVSLPQGVMALRSAAAPTSDAHAKARANAVDFEAMFLSSMFNNMFTSIDGEGPFGGGGAGGVWRSFLSDEYAKSFAKAGGIGLADSVYRSLIAQQETRGAQKPSVP